MDDCIKKLNHAENVEEHICKECVTKVMLRDLAMKKRKSDA
jgi:hypothetical protein